MTSDIKLLSEKNTFREFMLKTRENILFLFLLNYVYLSLNTVFLLVLSSLYFWYIFGMFEMKKYCFYLQFIEVFLNQDTFAWEQNDFRY